MQSKIESILSKYPTVFSGVGKLNNYQLKVHVNLDIPPVVLTSRRVPFHIRKAVNKETDINETLQGLTLWFSTFVAVPKANVEERICLDKRRANAAVIRECHPIPTIGRDCVQVLNGATVFSKLDLRWGCRQLELHPDSCGLTASSTTQGLKQYMRLIFGLSSASVMYQFVIQQVLNKIPGSRTHLMTLLSLAKSFANMPQLGSDTATPACQRTHPEHGQVSLYCS